jgi:guanine nucleotide-binding protein subunit alpha
MQMVHDNGYTTEERMKYRYTIRRSIIDCANALIEAMKEKKIWPESDVNGSYCNFLLEHVLDPDPDAALDDTVARAIHSLWRDPCIPKALESGIKFYMMDSAP